MPRLTYKNIVFITKSHEKKHLDHSFKYIKILNKYRFKYIKLLN